MAVVAAVFSRTLTSYFLADDIGEIKYVNQILDGRLDMLWSNFTGNYMQIPSMSVYRPCLLLSLLFDCAIWHGNAFGYYLTNLLYFSGDVVLFYLVAQKLTSDWGSTRSKLCAFAAALLFALNPLHTESISWIVGRVDAACCFYYLASFLLFMTANSARTLHRVSLSVAGTALFWVAITTKEMAIGLPVIVFSYAVLWHQSSAWDFARVETGTALNKISRLPFFNNVLNGLKLSLPLWISMAVYFTIRFCALGTILGGYTGSIGASQTANAITRWLDLDTWHRIFFPFAQEVFRTGSIWETALGTAYTITAAVIAVRLAAGIVPVRLLTFIALWSATALAPIYRLWGIGFNLEGARFIFFFTVPLTLLLTVLLFAPKSRSTELPKSLSAVLNLTTAASLALIAIVFAKAAYATNLLWVHAGKEVKSVLTEASALAQKTPADKRAIILGLPKEHGGAHMILNGDTFKMLLGMPFTANHTWNRFVTFEPVVFSPEPTLSPSRLKSALSNSSLAGPFVWSREQHTFVPVSYSTPASITVPNTHALPLVSGGACVPYTLGHALFKFDTDSITGEALKDGDGLRIANLSLNPPDWDYLQFEVKSDTEQPLPFTVKWKGETPAGSASEGATELPSAGTVVKCSNDKFTSVSIPLSRNFRWFENARVTELILLMPGVNELQIRNVRLAASSAIVPLWNIDTEPTNNGVFEFADAITISFDASKIPQTTSIDVEVSDTDFFFENSADARPLMTVRLNGKQQRFDLQAGKLPRAGFYQVRARAIVTNGEQQPYSDPITLRRK